MNYHLGESLSEFGPEPGRGHDTGFGAGVVTALKTHMITAGQREWMPFANAVKWL